eukprot:5881522-Prymnesium_polylepis.2
MRLGRNHQRRRQRARRPQISRQVLRSMSSRRDCCPLQRAVRVPAAPRSRGLVQGRCRGGAHRLSPAVTAGHT